MGLGSTEFSVAPGCVDILFREYPCFHVLSDKTCTSLFLQRFCPEADSKNMLQCLKQNKNSEVMDPKCKQMITKRQITQNTGIPY